jgi:hypothetical protein
MITADKLTLLVNMPAAMLEQTLPAKNRPSLQTAKFLGLTNGYEFCYSVVNTDGDRAKVFLKYDPTIGQVFGTLG